MYRLKSQNGDMVPVPRIIFSRLTAQGGPESRFRVALYLLATSEADAKQTAAALHIPLQEAELALQYWEGTGLLENIGEAIEVDHVAQPRRRMTTKEVVEAGSNDPMLGGMVGELQRIFGGLISQSDINIFVTLYREDGMPADLILLAASYFVSKGKTSARYIEKTLLSWQREGIDDCAAADRYLQQLALREAREREVAMLMDVKPGVFTLSERKRIAKWYEEYEYRRDMIETARMFAGERAGEVRYIDGILKKWHAKNWHTPRDVQQASDNRNLRVTAERRTVDPEDDIMMNAVFVHGQQEIAK